MSLINHRSIAFYRPTVNMLLHFFFSILLYWANKWWWWWWWIRNASMQRDSTL